MKNGYFRMASYPQCQFSIGFHSSHWAFLKYYTGDDYIQVFQDITNDVLLLNSNAEPDENREGGLLEQVIGPKFYSKDYDQDHGWVVRGDLEIPAVKVDVEDAVLLALEFALDRKDL